MRKALILIVISICAHNSFAQYGEQPQYFMISPDSVHMVDPYYQIQALATLKDTLYVESGKHFLAFASTYIDNGQDYILPSFVAAYNQKYDVVIDQWQIRNITKDHILFRLSYRKIDKNTGKLKGGRTVVQTFGIRKDDILGIYMAPGKEKMNFQKAESIFYMTLSLVGLIFTVSN